MVVRRLIMAVSGKYGKLDIPNIAEDEPIFVLRAQDQLAEAVLEVYRVLTASHHTPNAGQLDEEIVRFRNWTGPKKMPD